MSGRYGAISTLVVTGGFAVAAMRLLLSDRGPVSVELSLSHEEKKMAKRGGCESVGRVV